MAKAEIPEWRVKIWFLVPYEGWVGMEFAFVRATDRDHAIAYGIQRSLKRGFAITGDMKLEARYEDGNGML
jgi:hypothetical protein